MYSLWIAFPLLSALPPSLSLLLLSSTQPFRNHCLEHIGKKKSAQAPGIKGRSLVLQCCEERV